MLCHNAVAEGVVICEKRNDISFPFFGDDFCIVRLPWFQCKSTWSWKSFPTSAIISSRSNDGSPPKTNDISCSLTIPNVHDVFLPSSPSSASSPASLNSLDPLVDLFFSARKIHQKTVPLVKTLEFHAWNLLWGGSHRGCVDSLKDFWNRSQWISTLALIDYNKEKTLWFQLVEEKFLHFKQENVDSLGRQILIASVWIFKFWLLRIKSHCSMEFHPKKEIKDNK